MSTQTKALHNPWVLKIAARLRHGVLGFNALERSIEAPNPPMLSRKCKGMACLLARSLKSVRRLELHTI
jgi:DNA-binding HxlR family transcriptional regulator